MSTLVNLIMIILSFAVGVSIAILKLPVWFVVLLYAWAFVLILLDSVRQWERDHPAKEPEKK